MELSYQSDAGLTPAALAAAVQKSLEGGDYRRVLIIPPDFTRLHSGAGSITNCYYHTLTQRGCGVDILPALGTHTPMTPAQVAQMYGDIPFERFFIHNWRGELTHLGEIPGAVLGELTRGRWAEPITVALNPRVLDERYDLILSIGQVVPHEVAGMANHAKNLFVGVGGSDMIHKSHMLGAACGLEGIMGRDRTPVRGLFDYALETFLADRPLLFVLTVTTAAAQGRVVTNGLFIGDSRRTFEKAVALSREKNIAVVEKGIKKCVVYLDPGEFRSTWLGNKAVYRTRMAMENGGELLILAPGVETFGEDAQVDRLIRAYGYRGREQTLEQLRDNQDLRDNMSAAAHLIHGASDGRFRITYAVKNIPQAAIRAVGYEACDYDALAARYDPHTLAYGPNTLPDGEEIYFIPNPALGLWMDKTRFNKEENA